MNLILNFSKFLLAIFICFAFQSCVETEKIEDGMYQTNDNDIFYGLEISDNCSKIKFFILYSWSSSMPKDEIENQKNWEGFRTGDLIYENNELKAINISTDFFESRKDSLEITKSSNGIKINCEKLSQIFMGSFPPTSDGKLTINLGASKSPKNEIYFRKKN